MRRPRWSDRSNGVRAAPADSTSGAAGTNDPGADDPTPATLADATTADGEAVLADLVGAGIVDATGDDTRLTADFEGRWRAEIERLRARSTEDLTVATLAVAPTATATESVTESDRTFVVLSDGSGEPAGEVWLRRPVAVAETAAALALAEVTDLEAGPRAVAAHGLSVFLEDCPVCDRALETRKAGGCCGPPRTDAEGHPLRALVCPDCRTQFVAFE
ncbi:hypothetical protein I7X12_13320 [Halosimplex litoreum]|uniref:DUF8054 domain-containing protein n=1 Tax=Halosimplex litoreum TaxID=1198301 RepID=A0A7T3FW07_9EURY|nr:hypothetical protein [Halosimplex litoreum]QPV61727.1 hypothetical protein I7X12_13320 [Halosimplex litoreum]